MALYLLYESSTGYSLFKVHHDIQRSMESVQSSVSDLSLFGRIVQLTSFHPFHQINTVSEGNVREELIGFLKLNLPRVKKGRNPNFRLGVLDPKTGSYIFKTTEIPCQSNELVHELLRGVHHHFGIFFKDVEPGDLEKAKLGLDQSYVTSNVNGVENMVIQATYLLDTLDKVIDSFAMRVREWNSCHFPELDEIVDDNYLYARVSKIIEDKSKLSEEHIPMLTEVLGDEVKAKEIVEAGKTSIGQDLSPVNMNNVQTFAQRVIDLEDYRKMLYDYLVSKMRHIAPNLVSLIGEMIGARLISHAGSLKNLATCPSSTLQILGVKKAYLSALKTRGKTPKYGLIFHSSFIQCASGKTKGRIARSLASKCSIASRIDCFSDCRTTTFGEKLRKQIEERFKFCEKRVDPCKNIDLMEEVLGNLDQKENGDITKAEVKKDMEEEDQLVYALQQSCLSEENVPRE